MWQQSRAIAGRTARCRLKVRLRYDTYWILQQHSAVSLPQHGFLVYISDQLTIQLLKLHTVPYADNDIHGCDRKSR